MKMSDPWAIVVILAVLLLFFAIGYFLEKERARRAERLNNAYHLEHYWIEKAVDEVHDRFMWDATSKLSDKVRYLLQNKPS